ncbi:MAG: peptide deformylase [Bacteroidota bacterium]
MIYPIVAYGDPILRKKAVAIEEGADVQTLADDMLATMDQAQGVGLAAPQIGQSIRLFVVDFSQYLQEQGSTVEGRKVLINPELRIDEAVPAETFEEGCLSMPGVRVEVPRHEKITIRYFDTAWQRHEEEWTGFPARVMMHEYDHLEGKLHIDYAAPLRKNLLKSKLKQIRHGKVEVPYKMKFPV